MRGVGSLELLLWLWVHDSLVSLPLAARGRAHKQKSLDLLDLRPNPMRRGHHKRKRLKWMVDGPVASPLFSSVSDRAGPTHTFSLLPPPLLSPPLLSLSLALPASLPVSLIVFPVSPNQEPGQATTVQHRHAWPSSPHLRHRWPRQFQDPKLPSSQAPRAPGLQSEFYRHTASCLALAFLLVLPPSQTLWFCQLPGLAVLSSKNAAFSRACHAQ